MTKLRFIFTFLRSCELSLGRVRQTKKHSDSEFEITIENGESYVPIHRLRTPFVATLSLMGFVLLNTTVTAQTKVEGLIQGTKR